MDARISSHAERLDFATDIFEAADVRAASGIFHRAIASFGFDTFASCETDIRDARRTVFYVVAWPAGFSATYLTSRRLAACPVMRALARHDRPFTWADIEDWEEPDADDWRFLQVTRSFGWDHGLVVPLPRGGCRKGMVHMAGRATQPNDLATVAAMAMIYHERIRHMLVGSAGLLDMAGLVPREMEVLRLVAAGLPDAAIAGRLNTSQITINEMVHGARLKLGARTRAEAVSIMVSLGLVAM